MIIAIIGNHSNFNCTRTLVEGIAINCNELQLIAVPIKLAEGLDQGRHRGKVLSLEL